jgi:nitrogen fixation/metabolism regulation signal transduction histidine kinase
LRNRLLRAGGVIFLFAVAAGVVFSRRMTRPFQDIAAAAGDIAAGNWTRQVPIRGSAESTTMAVAFNEMSAHLRHWHQEAQDRLARVEHLNAEIQLQRLRVFKATMRTVQDIVNNLLNSLQIVHLEAEGQLPADVQTLIDGAIQEAALKLKTLGELETVTEKEMAIGQGIDYPGSAP